MHLSGDTFHAMELRHLRYFEAVVETLNISRAAEKLHVAQPALSRQIRDLEREIGAPLLIRAHGRVQLTKAGHVLHSHVGRLLLQVDIAVSAAQEAARGISGRLVIANDWRIPMQFLRDAVVTFRERYTDIDVSLTELRVHEQLPALRAGDIQLGFLPREFVCARDDIETLTVVRSNVVVVVGSDHAFARRKSVRLREFKHEKWLCPPDSAARDFVTRICQSAGFAPKFGHTAESIEGLLTLASLGDGVLLLLKVTLPHRPQRARVLETDRKPVELCAAWRNNESSQPLHHFIKLLRERLPSSVTISRSRARDIVAT